MPELARRVLFAIVAIPLTIGLIYIGGAPLAAALAGVAGVAGAEFFRIARAGGSDPFDRAGIALAAALPVLAYARQRAVFETELAPAALVLLTLFAAAIWRRGVEGRPLAAVAVTVLGVLYTGGMLSFGYALRYHRFVLGDPRSALALVMFPLLITWASDTGAYFTGRAIGGRRLMPDVSPGKTVAGAAGGLIAAILVGEAYGRTVLPGVAQLSFAPGALLGCAAAIGVAAQVGDLVESLLKREAGVKDSSRIIPGHGGVLDRFDSLLFVLPIAYLLLDHLLLFVPS